jgi:catechol 2,3-dioxygenase-like lactoylglutathione lyase family enzyme
VIQHASFEVSDIERSGAFYDALFGPLGWRRQFDDGTRIAWGIAKPIFVITARRAPSPDFGHICFGATGIAAVKAAWEAGIAAGGSDDGKPGPRDYAPGYYSAYLRDPDGYRVEVAVGTE